MEGGWILEPLFGGEALWETAFAGALAFLYVLRAEVLAIFTLDYSFQGCFYSEELWMRNSCRLICMTIASELRDSCRLICMTIAS